MAADMAGSSSNSASRKFATMRRWSRGDQDGCSAHLDVAACRKVESTYYEAERRIANRLAHSSRNADTVCCKGQVRSQGESIKQWHTRPHISRDSGSAGSFVATPVSDKGLGIEDEQLGARARRR
jgi:hypothetical protein